LRRRFARSGEPGGNFSSQSVEAAPFRQGEQGYGDVATFARLPQSGRTAEAQGPGQHLAAKHWAVAGLHLAKQFVSEGAQVTAGAIHVLGER
jgi:hypothetical protein